MVKKIDKFTPEQEANLSVIRDKWIAIGLSTEPANRAVAEAAIDEIYRAASLDPPEIRIWLGSPFAGSGGKINNKIS